MDFSQQLIDAGMTLQRVPSLEASLAAALEANATAESTIAALRGALEDIGIQLDATSTQLDAANVQLNAANAEIDRLKKPRGMFEVDEKFASTRMRWYGKLRESLAASGEAVRQVARTGNPEAIGFTVRDHIEYTAWAFRTTGDPVLRDEIAAVMNIVRERDLSAATTKDIAFLTSMYALAAYVLGSGETPHPDGAYWKQRAIDACTSGVPGDDLMHPYTASVLTAWLMWLLTGEERFKQIAEDRREELRRSITILECGRAVWFHRPKFAEAKVYGRSIPRTAYARYVIADLMVMLILGFEVIPAAALVETVKFLTRVANTIYYWLDGETYPNDSGIPVQFDPPKLTTSNLAFVISEDASGVLRARFEALTYSTPYVPAALVGD